MCTTLLLTHSHAAVFTTGAQKLFLLLQDALSDAPCDAVAKTHSLRTEVDVRLGAD